MLIISEILNKLNIVYYSYDKKQNMMTLNNRYANIQALDELIKLTYYFTNKKIKFTVLKNKSIVFKENFTFISSIKSFFKEAFTDIKNNRKNIYVLNDKKIKYAKNLPLFEIKFLDTPNLKIKQYDALIFTSQNAILALDKSTKEWKDIPSYVISEQSGKLIKDLKGKLKFFSRLRHGNEFAEELTPLLENKKVLYIRAEQVASDITNILKKNSIECDEVVMYKNVPLPNTQNKNLPKNSKIIFSSPSTIKYFFKHYEWKDTYRAIVIGKTTAQSLPSDIEFLISETTSLDSCVEKALETT